MARSNMVPGREQEIGKRLVELKNVIEQSYGRIKTESTSVDSKGSTKVV